MHPASMTVRAWSVIGASQSGKSCLVRYLQTGNLISMEDESSANLGLEYHPIGSGKSWSSMEFRDCTHLYREKFTYLKEAQDSEVLGYIIVYSSHDIASFKAACAEVRSMWSGRFRGCDDVLIYLYMVSTFAYF